MRLSGCLLAALLSTLACGQGVPDDGCQHNFDCPAGQACVSGTCAAVPCGGCQPGEACGADGNCIAAQGVSCADHACPSAYPCNAGGVCAKPCTLNSDCDSGYFCNSTLKSCSQCAFDSQCAAKTGTPVCNNDTGMCAQCNVNFDCVKALGAGHFCDAHVCKSGCKTTADCNASLSETCDTATTPGRCVQCHTDTECQNAFGPSAGACDDTGHCVQCWGRDQTSANGFCGGQECNIPAKACVACLPANNANGADCGYPVGGTRDPHDAATCDPDSYRCVPGCQFDSQCGCPAVTPGGPESACARFPDQEHCDPKRGTNGSCVQCTTNTQCEYKIAAAGHPYGTMNGARCVNDNCVEGCDADADCWPDHATPNGKTCHLGSSLDPMSHKCVQCECAALDGDTNTYCQSSRCGATQVCDGATLTCRQKRQGERCLDSNECGDNHDPSNSCIGSLSLCVYASHDGAGIGGSLSCSPDGSFGRCGVPCDDFQNNYCTGTTHCPVNSRCRQATDGGGHAGAMCVTMAPSGLACTY